MTPQQGARDKERQTEPRGRLLNNGRGRPHLRRAPAGSVCEDKPPTTLHLDTLGTHCPITGLLKSSGSPRDSEVGARNGPTHV